MNIKTKEVCYDVEIKDLNVTSLEIDNFTLEVENAYHPMMVDILCCIFDPIKLDIINTIIYRFHFKDEFEFNHTKAIEIKKRIEKMLRKKKGCKE